MSTCFFTVFPLGRDPTNCGGFIIHLLFIFFQNPNAVAKRNFRRTSHLSNSVEGTKQTKRDLAAVSKVEKEHVVAHATYHTPPDRLM